MTIRSFSRLSLVCLVNLLLASCSTVTRTHGSERLNSRGRWAILPVANLAETAQAGERVEALLDTVLRGQGISALDRYPPGKSEELAPLTDDRTRYETSLAWARAKHYDYAVTGTVEEWRYKAGAEADPAVGLTLQIIDIPGDKVLWSGSGASVGAWGDNVSGVALRLLSNLAENLRFQ